MASTSNASDISSVTNHKSRGIIIRDNKILLIHRFNHGEEYWTIPGGSIDLGETPEHALKREIVEETSLQLQDCELIKILDSTTYLFLCLVNQGELSITGGPELTGQSPVDQYIPSWVDIGLLPSLIIYPTLDSPLHEILSHLTPGQKQKWCR